MINATENNRGFTLIEVLVSFVILALALTTLFRAISGGLVNIGAVDLKTEALGVAQSRLAEVGHSIPLEAGETQGNIQGRYNWKVQVKNYEKQKGAKSIASAFWVEVIVSDVKKPDVPAIILRSLKLKQKERLQ